MPTQSDKGTYFQLQALCLLLVENVSMCKDSTLYIVTVNCPPSPNSSHSQSEGGRRRAQVSAWNTTVKPVLSGQPWVRSKHVLVYCAIIVNY